MQIEQTRVMRGPNYWSDDVKKLIVLKVRFEQAAEFESGEMRAFTKQLADTYPFIEMGEISANMPALLARLGAKFQSLAGLSCTYWDMRPTAHADVFYAIFSYEEEQSGLFAAEAALRLIKATQYGQVYNLQEDLDKLKQVYRRNALGPSTKSIADEAMKRGIPVTRLDRYSWMMLGHGVNQRTFRSTVASTTSNLAVELVSNKDATKKVLAENFLPVPKGRVVKTEEELEKVAKAMGYPLVVKPLNGNHGRGITTDINCREGLETAFAAASLVSDNVIVERHVSGSDYRFLVVNFKLVAAARRVPARVIGDGVSTIRQLVDEVNQDPRRGMGHEMELTAIGIDNHTRVRLERLGLSADSILDEGQVLDLKDTANISTGGTAEDVTDLVHADNVFLAERVARILDLDICGIDLVADSIEQPINSRNGAILEVNAGPGLRMHLAPTVGTARNVAAPIVDLMFPDQAPSRIPTIAITGTNGKTTTTRLLAHMAKHAGYRVGFTTTDGIYVQDRLVTNGDCSGPASAAVIFRDPGVNFAVLECARGGILRSGLGFDHCDVSIVTNVSSDHLGISDIDTLEQLARIKSVVPKSTTRDGYAILNADDDVVFGMRRDLQCNIALFSMNPQNPRIEEHVQKGGIAAVVDGNYFTILANGVNMRIAAVPEVPLTLGGKAECMTMNILPTLLTAYLYNFSLEAINNGLMSFVPSPENTPGRMNVFEFKSFRMMVDYAHNQGSFVELKKYADKENATVKVGIITCPGDRNMEDVITIGRQAAEIFDEIIIRHDKDGRGRPREVMTEWLMTGIKQVDPDKWVIVISDEKEAIQYAMDHARPGSWIFVNTEKVFDTLAFVTAAREKEAILV